MTVGTRAKIPIAFYRRHEADDSRRPLPRARGRRCSPPLPWARRQRFPSPFTAGRSLARALYRGREAEYSRRPFAVGRNPAVALHRRREAEGFRRLLSWARGRRSPSPLTVGTVGANSCRPFTVGARPKIPADLLRGREVGHPHRRFNVGARLESPAALYRGHEAEYPRRPSPLARGGRFPSHFHGGREAEDARRLLIVGGRGKIPVALYRGREAEASRRPLLWARGGICPSPFTVRTRPKVIWFTTRAVADYAWLGASASVWAQSLNLYAIGRSYWRGRCLRLRLGACPRRAFWRACGAVRAAPALDGKLGVEALVVVTSCWFTPLQWSLFDGSRVVSLAAAGSPCFV